MACELQISVQGLAGEAAGGGLRARFDTQGGSIGRADDNTLVLPDPRRHISRHQADIVFRDGDFQIVNAPQSNPITLNRTALEPGGTRVLQAGDELLIGGYVLRVEGVEGVNEGASGRPREDAAGLLPVTGWLSAPSAPAGDDEDGSSPFADLLAPRAAPTAAAVPSASHPSSPSSSRAATGRAALPEDYDPFAVTGLGAAPTPAPVSVPPFEPSSAPSSARAGLIEDGTSSLDPLFGLDRAAPVAWEDWLAPGAASAPAADRQAPLDPLARFLPPAPAPVRAGPGPAAWDDHTPELHAAFDPPAVRPVRPVAEPLPLTPPRSPAPADGALPARLWRAFEAGAGLPPSGESLSEDALAARMQLLGALMVAGLDGTLRLMAARASTKQELRAEVTVIQPTGNNPLKFTRDAQAALRSLVQPPARGFMAAVPAWTDAMDDLLGHTVGTMAGMRAALDGLLAHFEPEKLEAALATPSLLESLLPAHRRAHLWQAYLERHRQVQTAAAEDFHGLFGRAFVQAYEAQLQRLDAARTPPHAAPGEDAR